MGRGRGHVLATWQFGGLRQVRPGTGALLGSASSLAPGRAYPKAGRYRAKRHLHANWNRPRRKKYPVVENKQGRKASLQEPQPLRCLHG